MRVLVTGGSGFLGSHIVEQLAAGGHQVRALVRRSSDTRFLRGLSGVELVDGAVDDRPSFVAAAAGVEAIIHSAGLVKARSEAEFHAVNRGGTENAVHAAEAAGAGLRRLVLVSSQAVQGPSNAAGDPVPSDGPPRPVTAYGRSKAEAERVVRAAAERLPVAVVRPPAIFGPRDQEFLAVFRAIKTGVLPYMGSRTSRLSMIYGADAAAACIAAATAEVPSGSVHFVDDGQVHTFEEFVGAAEQALGSRAWLRFPLPRPVVELAALGSELSGKVRGKAVMLTRDKCNELFEQWVGDSAPAREALGWRAEVPLAEGVRRTIEWYRAQGLL